MKEKVIFLFVIALLFTIFGIAMYQRDQDEKMAKLKTDLYSVLGEISENKNNNAVATNQETIPTIVNEPSATAGPTQTPMPTQGPPPMTIDKSKTYVATIETSEGTMTLELYDDKTPITVNNFVTLARKSFYDNTIFHRVISGFMIQGGDPQGTGGGGPGYTFADEPFEGDYTRGTLAMANAGPNTNGSQFFIMHADNGLPKQYVIFGRVTGGIEVVDKIASAPVTSGPTGEQSKPVTPVSIKKITISEN